MCLCVYVLRFVCVASASIVWQFNQRERCDTQEQTQLQRTLSGHRTLGVIYDSHLSQFLSLSLPLKLQLARFSPGLIVSVILVP